MDIVINIGAVEKINSKFDSNNKNLQQKKDVFNSSYLSKCSNNVIQKMYGDVSGLTNKLAGASDRLNSTLISYYSEVNSLEGKLATPDTQKMSNKFEAIVDESLVISSDHSKLHKLGLKYFMYDTPPRGAGNYTSNYNYTQFIQDCGFQCVTFVSGRIYETTGLRVQLGSARNWPQNGVKYGFERIYNLSEVKAGDAVSLVKDDGSQHIIFCEGVDANGVQWFTDGNTSAHAWGTLVTMNDFYSRHWKFNGAVNIHDKVGA